MGSNTGHGKVVLFWAFFFFFFLLTSLSDMHGNNPQPLGDTFQERLREEKINPSSAICAANAEISAMYGKKSKE